MTVFMNRPQIRFCIPLYMEFIWRKVFTRFHAINGHEIFFNEKKKKFQLIYKFK